MLMAYLDGAGAVGAAKVGGDETVKLPKGEDVRVEVEPRVDEGEEILEVVLGALGEAAVVDFLF